MGQQRTSRQSTDASASGPILLKKSAVTMHEMPSLNQSPNNIGYVIGRCTGRKKAEIATVTVHDVHESGMIDGVVRSIGPWHLRIVDFIGIGRRAYGPCIASQ